jgi:transposase
MTTDQELERKFATILPCLNERQRRLLLAAEARSLGYGGISRVSRASGISRATIQTASKQLDSPLLPGGRVRSIGGGRKRVHDKDPAILEALERLIAPETRGDPMSPLRWTCKSTRHLAEALAQKGFTVSHRLVGEMLHHLGYSLQANAKTLGSSVLKCEAMGFLGLWPGCLPEVSSWSGPRRSLGRHPDQLSPSQQERLCGQRDDRSRLAPRRGDHRV